MQTVLLLSFFGFVFVAFYTFNGLIFRLRLIASFSCFFGDPDGFFLSNHSALPPKKSFPTTLVQFMFCSSAFVLEWGKKITLYFVFSCGLNFHVVPWVSLWNALHYDLFSLYLTPALLSVYNNVIMNGACQKMEGLNLHERVLAGNFS